MVVELGILMGLAGSDLFYAPVLIYRYKKKKDAYDRR